MTKPGAEKPQSSGPVVRWRSWALALNALAAAILAVLAKRGAATEPDEGAIFDCLRHLPYVMAGLAVSYRGGSLKAVFAWAAALNGIDKAIVGIAVALLPSTSVT